MLCDALHVIFPPPYKHFAKELAGDPGKGRPALMPRKDWRHGQRVGTATWYLVPDHAAAVVDLASAKRERA